MGLFILRELKARALEVKFLKEIKSNCLIKKVEKKNIFKSYLNVLTKHVQFQSDYMKFSEYVKTRHILETAARKIQKYFRGRKISKEKQFLLEEASVFFFFKEFIWIYEIKLKKYFSKKLKKKEKDLTFHLQKSKASTGKLLIMQSMKIYEEFNTSLLNYLKSKK